MTRYHMHFIFSLTKEVCVTTIAFTVLGCKNDTIIEMLKEKTCSDVVLHLLFLKRSECCYRTKHGNVKIIRNMNSVKCFNYSPYFKSV